MEIRLLGPVEVTFGSTVVDLGSPKQRCVLAALLWTPEVPVSVGTLIDRVWGEDPPRGARDALYSYVTRLRRAFDKVGDSDGGPVQLLRTPAGYTLTVDPLRVDVHRFRELLASARRVAAADPVSASGLLREALGLWRGTPCADVPGSWAEHVRESMIRLRLTVVTELAGLERRLGRHGELVDDLFAWAEEYPLAEPLAGQLMLALAGSGRRAEALEFYARFRQRVVEALGDEPGPELQRLHQRLLRREPVREPVASGKRDVAPVSPDPVSSVATVRARSPLTVFFGVLALVLGGTMVGSAPVTSESSIADEGASAGGEQVVTGPTWVSRGPVPSTLFGITVGSNSGAMPDFRVGAVRFWDSRTRWANVQPARDQWDWASLDRMVDGASRAGRPVLYTMGMTPAWANPEAPASPYTDHSKAAPPVDLNDWDGYVRAVVTRFRGRIEAYELWDYVSNSFRYNGDLATLVEMVRRASRIIKDVDPHATVVCPSMGDVWEAAGREFMFRFAQLGGYQPCDAAGMKLHPRHPRGRPEEMVEAAGIVDITLHRAGVHLPMWVTGPGHDIATAGPLSEWDANNFAVRFFLVGIYLRYERMYFYSWGPRNLPLVLQAEGGEPTRAARYVEELQWWLADAVVRSCARGESGGLPANVWGCRFDVPTPGAGTEAVVIRWTDGGTAEMRAEPGAYHMRRLDGRDEPIGTGQRIQITEEPTLIGYR